MCMRDSQTASRLGVNLTRPNAAPLLSTSRDLPFPFHKPRSTLFAGPDQGLKYPPGERD